MKTLFNTLDPLNRRILVVAFAISLVLFSLSCFIFTASNVFADQGKTKIADPRRVGAGVDNSWVYYYYDNVLYKQIKSDAKEE